MKMRSNRSAKDYTLLAELLASPTASVQSNAFDDLAVQLHADASEDAQAYADQLCTALTVLRQKPC